MTASAMSNSNRIFAHKYKLKRMIGSGSFGEVFLAINLQNGVEFAVKLESQKARNPQLLYEFKVYRLLEGRFGIPRVEFFGVEPGYSFLVMDLLGPTLEDMFNLCERKFSLKTVLMIAYQMLNLIEYVHSKGYIYRDIKPDNFLLGIGPHCNVLFLVDFGLAKRYIDLRTLQHIPLLKGRSMVGTARYASINAHDGVELSRRDDLESIGYVLIYFLRNGSLPWQDLHAKNKKDKYRKIGDKKHDTSIDLLCKGLPEEFAKYLRYCRTLPFNVTPDYAHLHGLFHTLFDSNKYQYDYNYDWTIMKGATQS